MLMMISTISIMIIRIIMITRRKTITIISIDHFIIFITSLYFLLIISFYFILFFINTCYIILLYSYLSFTIFVYYIIDDRNMK